MKMISPSTFGIGTDIFEISRLNKKEVLENDAFLNRIFSKRELDYCFSKKTPLQRLASRFSGKEAMIKALGDAGIQFSEYNKIEIINNEIGAPLVYLNHPLLKDFVAKLSLSHSEKYALAFALVLKKETKRAKKHRHSNKT